MIAIPVERNALESPISTRFGKSEWFALVDGEGSIMFLANPHGGGAEVLRWLSEQGVEKIITAHIGPKPHAMLREANIRVYDPGTERTTLPQALSGIEEGLLEEITEANLHRYYTDKPKGTP